MADKNMNAKISVDFEESASRQSLNSGDSLPTLFGKTKKFFSDLKPVALSGSYNDLTDIPKTTEVMNTSEVSNLITITDAAADTSLISLNVYGRSTQGYASHGGEPLGKNLFDFIAWKNALIKTSLQVESGTIQWLDNNSFTITATGDDCYTNQSLSSGIHQFIVKPNTTYTLAYTFEGTDKNGSVLIFSNGVIADIIGNTSNSNAKITFATKTDTTFVTIRFAIRYSGDYGTFSNIQLEEGSVATTYESYYSNPNPDCPVPIESVGDSGSVTATTCGKNLYEGSQDWSGEWMQTVSWVDSKETYNGLKVKERLGTWLGLYKILYAEAGKTYIFSGYVKANTEATVAVYPNRPFGDGSHVDGAAEPLHVANSAIPIGMEWTRVSCKFVCTKSGFINPRIEGMIGGVKYYVCGYQFEESPEMTDYEPYKSTTATVTTALPLRGIPVLTGDGNYTDTNGKRWVCDELIVNADGTGKIIKRINTIVFDGSSDEYWVMSNNNKRIVTDKLNGVAAPAEATNVVMYCLADRLVPKSANDTYSGIEGISFDNTARVGISLSALVGNSDITVWTTYLANNPITVVYQLAIPTETELTADEVSALLNLRTYNGVTNIFNSENADILVKYWCDDSMSALISTKANTSDVLPIAGGTMQGALVAQTNTNYTTPQVRNVSMSTETATGGNNGQIHFQYV